MSAAVDGGSMFLEFNYFAAIVAVVEKLLDEDDFDEARFQLGRAIANYPGEAEGHRRLGELYVRLGLTTEAVNSFERAIFLDSDHIAGYVALAKLRAAQCRVHEALQLLAEARLRSPNDLAMLEQYCTVCLAQGNLHLAVDLISTWMNASPNNPRALEALAKAARSAGDLVSAEMALQSARALSRRSRD